MIFSKSKHMINALSAPPENSLIFTEFVVNGTVNSVQDNSTENFAGNGKKCDATAVEEEDGEGLCGF